jgi:hypothetical protein
MKQAYTFLFVLALIVSANAVPASANGIGQASNFSVELAGFPDTVKRGEKITGTITLTLDPTVSIKRQQVGFQLFISTPLGDAPVRTGSFLVPKSGTKTIHVSFPVSENAPAGQYELRLVITFDGETATVTHALTVE